MRPSRLYKSQTRHHLTNPDHAKPIKVRLKYNRKQMGQNASTSTFDGRERREAEQISQQTSIDIRMINMSLYPGSNPRNMCSILPLAKHT